MDNQARSTAFTKILDTCDYLEERGVKQRVLRRRDKREPGRRRKEMMEDRIYAAVMRYFRDQKRQIKENLEIWYPGRKAELPPGFALFESVFGSDKFKAQMIKLLGDSILDGIKLFGETQKIGIDYTLVNAEAIDWARNYGFDLVKGIDQTSKDVLQKVISSFAEIPGMTIGDVVDRLPYDEQRALMIATTEITRAYAEGNANAGHELQKQFPDVKIVEIWFTNEDDRVCDICGPVAGEEVELDKPFSNGFDRPPAHVNCRCWTTTTTALGGEMSEEPINLKFESNNEIMMELSEKTSMKEKQSEGLNDMEDAFAKGEKYSKYGFSNLNQSMHNYDVGMDIFHETDKMSLEERIAFEAGMTGKNGKFEFVTAWRVGDIPQGGYSYNFAEQKLETGLSVMAASNGMETKDKFSAMFIMAENRPVVYVSGFVHPFQTGSDGEPIILFAEFLKKIISK